MFKNLYCLIWVLLCLLSFCFYLPGMSLPTPSLSVCVFPFEVRLLWAALTWVMLFSSFSHPILFTGAFNSLTFKVLLAVCTWGRVVHCLLVVFIVLCSFSWSHPLQFAVLLQWIFVGDGVVVPLSFSLNIFCRFLVCGYHEAYVYHFISVTVYFKLIGI